MPPHTFSDKHFGTVELNAVSVKQKLAQLHVFNREDLIDELKKAWDDQEIKTSFPEFAIEKVEFPTFIDRVMETSYFQTPVSWGPKEPNEELIRVHRGSMETWKLGKCGNCFTGVVRIGTTELVDEMPRYFAKKFDKDDYKSKIFLLPCQPSDHYPTRPWAEFEARVYGAKCSEAIIHGNIAQGGKQSHRQLVDVINRKEAWEGLTQERAFFLGFTVVKGSATMPDRFAFTSMSSNQPVHLPHMSVKTLAGPRWMKDDAQTQNPPTGTVTKAWAIKIRDTIRSLPK